MLLWNLLLALAWAAVRGNFNLANLSLGFLMGYVLLWITRRGQAPSTYHQRVFRFLSFLGFYLWELLLSNLRVARDVLFPGRFMRPGVIAVPLECRTDTEIALLSNLITLTPGTLSVDVSTDRKVLYIHAMYIGEPEVFRREIKDGLERRVLEVLR
jgi:multicomponent Na+:H+ antiporter subunit E